MDKLNRKDFRYQQAAGRIREIKGYYIHLAVYAAVNLVILIDFLTQQPADGENQPYNFFTGVLWGAVIIIHAVSIFLPGIRKWEQAKTETFLKQELAGNPQNCTMTPEEENAGKLRKAREKVKKIKEFYIHSLCYVVVNILIIIIGLNKGKSITDMDHYWVAIFWGIGLLSHWASVFIPYFMLGSKWEERKIREYMDKYP